MSAARLTFTQRPIQAQAIHITGSTDMRHIKKDLKSNKHGETMVEVIVAFTLLALMLLIFSQGLAWAANFETTASKNRNDADSAMTALQRGLADGSLTADSTANVLINSDNNFVRKTYKVNGILYVVYSPS